jgi:hypothetical protein
VKDASQLPAFLEINLSGTKDRHTFLADQPRWHQKYGDAPEPNFGLEFRNYVL